MSAGLVLGGRYELQAQLGAGGFGSVWRARDNTLLREIAVKLIQFESDADSTARAVATQRFLREAQAVAGLNHPNVVAAYDFGVQDDTAYLVMELVHGTSLAQQMARRRQQGLGPMDVASVIRVAIEICSGLGAAHRAGLVHRDLKPANVMIVEPSGQVKIVDFGIARVADRSRLTRTGSYMGTLPYIAPEQMSTAPMDGRADIYSLGCLLHELLTGRSPYVAESPVQWLAAHQYHQPAPLSSHLPGAPMALERLILDMLAKDPAARPPTAEAVQERLAAIRVGAAGGVNPMALPVPGMAPPPDRPATSPPLPPPMAIPVVAPPPLATPVASSPTETEAFAPQFGGASAEAFAATEAVARTEAVAPTEAVGRTEAVPATEAVPMHLPVSGPPVEAAPMHLPVSGPPVSGPPISAPPISAPPISAPPPPLHLPVGAAEAGPPPPAMHLPISTPPPPPPVPVPQMSTPRTPPSTPPFGNDVPPYVPPPQPPRRSSRVAIVVLSVAIVLVIAAAVVAIGPLHLLSKKNNGPSVGGPSPSGSASNPNGNGGGAACQLKIAYLGTRNSPFGTRDDAEIRGMQLAIDEYNRAHQNCPVTGQFFDTNPNNLPNQPAPAARDTANKLVADTHVIGVIGPATSGDAGSVGGVLKAAGIVSISPSATSDNLTGAGGVFHRAIGGRAILDKTVGSYVAGIAGAKAFLVDDGSTYGKQMTDGVKSVAGGQVIGTSRVAAEGKQTNFSSTVKRIKDSGANVVVYGGYAQNAGRLLNQLRAAGSAAQFLVGDVTDQPQFAQLAGSAATAGSASIFCLCGVPSHANPSFATTFAAANGGMQPNLYADVAFDMTNMMLSGILKGATTRAKLLNYINTSSYQGPVYKYRFTADGSLDPADVVANRITDNGAGGWTQDPVTPGL